MCQWLPAKSVMAELGLSAKLSDDKNVADFQAKCATVGVWLPRPPPLLRVWFEAETLQPHMSRREV